MYKGALVNHTLNSLSAGVSQQYEEGRFESQVDEMVNCIPSLSRGVLRRNPLIGTHYITDLPQALLNQSFVYFYDRGTLGEQYAVVIPGNGELYVIDLNTGNLLYKKEGDKYLTLSVGQEAYSSFAALTIADHTFIVNKHVEVSFTDKRQDSAGYEDMAFYWIKKTTLVTKLQKQVPGPAQSDPIETGSLSQGYTYALNSLRVTGTKDTRPNVPEINLSTSFEIAEEFSKYPEYSFADKHEKSFAYNTNFDKSYWIWEDTFGNEASLGVWKNIDDQTRLPAEIPPQLDGFIVKVSGGTSNQFDDYYLQYIHNNKTWKEIPAVDSFIELLPDSMPHVLYRLSDGSFIFDTYQGVNDQGDGLTGESEWTPRTSGGDDPLHDPSFVGHTIKDIFFFRNRLGVLTEDSIVLSQIGAYGTFFPQTIQEVLDDDPIDVGIAGTDVTNLSYAIPTSDQLLIFSKYNQFTLKAEDGPLTPKAAEVGLLSNYSCNTDVTGKAIGNKVYFPSISGGYSQIYTYKLSTQYNTITNTENLSIHIPSYISKNVKTIAGHDVLGYVFFLLKDEPTTVVVLNTLERNEEELQNAFHKWEFEIPVVHMDIINNGLYILFESGDLGHIDLELPADISIIDYIDYYPSQTKLIPYDSYIKFSNFYFRDAQARGTKRGRYMLRTILYTIDNNISWYETLVANIDHGKEPSDNFFGDIWDDSLYWDDTLYWLDEIPNLYRIYPNDEKVSILGDNKKTEIIFKSSSEDNTKGFELATANVEALFHQRSLRT